MTGWDGFAKYVGIQGVLALSTTVFMGIMLATSQQVPDVVYSLIGTAWGFYFAKNGYSIKDIGKKTDQGG